MVFHVAALLDAHEVLHWVEVLADAGAGQELLVRHRIAQVDRDVVVVGQRDVVALLGLVTRTHLVVGEERKKNGINVNLSERDFPRHLKGRM